MFKKGDCVQLHHLTYLEKAQGFCEGVAYCVRGTDNEGCPLLCGIRNEEVYIDKKKVSYVKD